MRCPGRPTAVGLGLLLLAACSLPPTVAQTPTVRPGDVRIIGVAELDAFRAAAGPLMTSALGHIQLRVSCTAPTLNDACRDSMRRHLEAAVAERGSNLAVIINESFLESNPPEYEVTATLYTIGPRP